MERKHQIECGADGKLVLEASREKVKLQLNEEALGAAPPCEQRQLEKVKKEACVWHHWGTFPDSAKPRWIERNGMKELAGTWSVRTQSVLVSYPAGKW